MPARVGKAGDPQRSYMRRHVPAVGHQRHKRSLCNVFRTTNAALPIAHVIDVGGFDLARAVAQKPAFLMPEYPFEWAGTFELPEGLR
jgi:hypothetical protein